MLLKLAFASLRHRKVTVLLTLFSITISIAIVLTIAHLNTQAREHFTNTISGTDLIVGARTGRINLLLYSVFRIGNATNNIDWKSYQTISQQKGVAWAIPISLGDSHKGYRVIGTNKNYFEHFRYGQKQRLAFKEGKGFDQEVFEVVLGADIAKTLGYELGQQIIVSHGISKVSLNDHDNMPFTVTGILKPTGTPIDQSLHISLEGMEAIHLGWRQGVPLPGLEITPEQALKANLTPKTITAFLVGMENKLLTFRVQRAINNFKGEPLMAILPGVALSELWQTMGVVERLLTLIAALVVIASLLGTITMMLSTLHQRQREIVVLRACGAPARFIFVLIELEVLLITLAAIVISVGLVWLGGIAAQPFLLDHYGLNVSINPFNETTLIYGGVVLLLSSILALIPAIGAYRKSLQI